MMTNAGGEVVLAEETYTTYVKLYADSILRIAVNYCNNRSDAEDIVQEVFLKLLETETNFKNQEHAKRWLIRVTINTCKNHLSSAWRRKMQPMGFQELDLALCRSEGDNVAWSPADDEAKPLYQAVASLPEKYRSVVHLYYYEAYSVKEIAQILQKKETTIQTGLMRARKLLKRKLKGAWQDE